jgi:carbon-monoxide dehydrogenase large subunit
VGLIEADWEELPVVVDMEEALAGKQVIHPEFQDNICFKREHDTGGVDDAFREADVVVEDTFHFGRHTGVCLEGRAILADYNAAEHSLTVYHATQAPHMMQDIFSRHLGIPEANVRVICKDVGGSFGIKVHVYADEMATAAISVIMRRPVKFVADRLESFLSDIHCREHRVKVKVGVKKTGEIVGFDLDDLDRDRPVLGLSAHQRHRGQPGGEPHRRPVQAPEVPGEDARRLHQQERHLPVPRGRASDRGGADRRDRRSRRAEDRHGSRRVPQEEPDSGRRVSVHLPSGIKFEKLSHHQTLNRLLDVMGYEKLKRERDDLRKQGVYRGIGLAAMIEVTNPSPAFYGVGGARISAQDGASLRLEPTGMVTVMCSVTEQGQGTEAIFHQIAASAVGVTLDKVKVITGDTAVTPYGGGTWASRGAGIGGEAVLQAGRALANEHLEGRVRDLES